MRDNLLHKVLKDVPDWALLLALVRVPLLLLDNYLYSVLQATGQFGLYNTPPAAAARRLRLVLVAIFVMGLNMGLPAAVATYTFIGVRQHRLAHAHTCASTIHFSLALRHPRCCRRCCRSASARTCRW